MTDPVKIAKRVNPLGIVMAVVFGLICAGAVASGDFFWGLFWAVGAWSATKIKEDAE